MNEKPRRTQIRIDLTRRQREQIRQATGREVRALELGLESLPEPDLTPAFGHPSPSRADGEGPEPINCA
jgi:hypothetical protein